MSLHRIGPVRRDSKIAAQRPCWIPVAPGTPNDLSKSAEVRLSKSAFVPATYKNRTKSAESRGLEKDDRRERIFELGRLRAVQRFAREGPCLLGIFPLSQAGREYFARCDWRRVQSDANLSLPALQGDFVKMQGDTTLLFSNQHLFAMAYEISPQPILQGEI